MIMVFKIAEEMCYYLIHRIGRVKHVSVNVSEKLALRITRECDALEEALGG